MNLQIAQEQTDILVTIPRFSLADTLDCGQAFRWTAQPNNSFTGVACGRFLHVTQHGDTVIFHNTTQSDFDEIWRPYFDLDTDYDAIHKALSFQPTIRTAMEHAGGIRILRQEPWETLCSFIISQNNNIPRIKGILSRLCEHFGEELAPGVYDFPTAQTLAACTVDDLSPLRAGFRAKYLIDAAQKVTSGEVDFTRIQNASLPDGEAELTQIFGVGVKVAQCVLLFGFHKLDAFPVDVWVKRILARYFPRGFPKRAKRYGGVAQQYLFHYERTLEKGRPDE